MPKFYYFLGGLGSNVEIYARDYSKKHPTYVFIDFITIMLSRDSYVDKTDIISYPPYLNTQSYSETKLAIGEMIRTAVKNKSNIILYGAGLNIQYNLNFIDYLKQIGYEIISIYVDVKIEKQLENVAKLNADPNSRIYIPTGVVIDTQNLLNISINQYKEASNKLKKIK